MSCTRPANRIENSHHLGEKAQQAYALLAETYGVPTWRRRGEPLDELILTVLSQNTSDINSERAFKRLKQAFSEWEKAAAASEAEIAAVIRSAGLANIKAKRIKAILKSIRERHGSLDLTFLSEMNLPEAKAWLRELDGVGPKTAACVLLFSLGLPTLPVDTHVYRVSRRLGLLNSNASLEAAHIRLEALVKPDQVYAFHINLIAHGREICKAQKPQCKRCPLDPICDYSNLQREGRCVS